LKGFLYVFLNVVVLCVLDNGHNMGGLTVPSQKGESLCYAKVL